MKENDLKILLNLLGQASELELSLLDSYLYTASSIKSMPQEFETLNNGKPNRRKAIQFEKARRWKQDILKVSHEEMLHLHYVQCLLRALDASPKFKLPPRDPETDNWVISNWDIYIPESSSKGTEIPIYGLDIEQIKRFILFESTDSLQDANPFGEKTMALFEQLFHFELELHLEGILYNINDDKKRNKVKNELKDIYLNLSPDDGVRTAFHELAITAVEDVAEYVRFQSIGDFYTKGILPLFEQAFEHGHVKNNNRAFNNEILGPDAAEGFLPVGPVYRSKNYTEMSQANTANPLRHFKNVKSIIEEIVEEGEGFDNFETMVKNLLQKVDEIGGERAYLESLKNDKAQTRNPEYSTPQWLADAQLCRESHLYKFAMIFMDLNLESELAEQAGVDFTPIRPKVSFDAGNHALEKMIAEMPRQFNACYMVMLLWLGRIYEIKEWQSDKDRRLAIEMIATWPLMSLAIRPFLELISFFPVDLKMLYRIDANGLPNLPTEALQLLPYFENTERNEEINKQIDYLALRVLGNAADWANEQIGVVEESSISGNPLEMIVTRLKGLSNLSEFEKQFPFREHGGYSNKMPDLTYQQEVKNPKKYEEDPQAVSPGIFKDSLVLKLRFGGFGLVQLSTDPDPPTDESGCTGTQMLHAADNNKRFDRALVWQNLDSDRNILREPRSKLPEIGVNLIDMSVMVTSTDPAQVNYVPKGSLNSTGAVQASGTQLQMEVSGLHKLTSYSKDAIAKGKHIRINLLEKEGQRPLLFGENHLVSKDGEPIDPFLLTITDDTNKDILTREIYNEGISMKAMNPLQRLETVRWPTGFDMINNIPEWLLEHMPDVYREAMAQGPGGVAPKYLGDRAAVLFDSLLGALGQKNAFSQKGIDEIISFAERMYLINVPRSTTRVWLGFLLHYGHSLSGTLHTHEANNPLYERIARDLNLDISCVPENDVKRTEPNSRWLVKYTQGVMDTDAITELVFGEIYIPVRIQPNGKKFKVGTQWTFAKGMLEAVAEYACNFHKPFWAEFIVKGDTRKTNLPGGVVILETLKEKLDHGYVYDATGVTGINDYQGRFRALEEKNGDVVLTLDVEYNYENEKSFLFMTQVVGGFFDGVSTALEEEFSPRQK